MTEDYVVCLNCRAHRIYESEVVDMHCIGTKQYDGEPPCLRIWRWTDKRGHSGYASRPALLIQHA